MTAIAVGVSACGAGSDHSRPAAPAAQSNASALKVVEVRIPRLKVPRYVTRGRWLQLASNRGRLRKVNAALFKVLRDEQRRYARVARADSRHFPAAVRRRYTGLFQMSPRRDLISASTVVVSVMVAERALLPGGNDGDSWL